MSPVAPFQHDVFISYQRADDAWAQRLCAGLKARGMDVFLDQPSLQPGAPWEPQLRQEAEASQHVVVLWSNHTKDSAWVYRELGYFDLRINSPAAGQKPHDQLMIFVLLEGDNPAYGSLQKVTHLKGDPYTRGLANLDPTLWDRVMTDVVNAIQKASTLKPIPLAIMAMTDAEFAALDPAFRPTFGDPFGRVLTSLGFATKADLAPFYGPSRQDWRPFGGGGTTIWGILERIRQEFNAGLGIEPFRWVLADNEFKEFWGSDLGEVQSAAAKLLQGPSVVVVDPLSLHDSNIYRRFGFLSSCFLRKECTVIGLTPFCLPRQIQYLRDQLKSIATPFFDSYYTPPVRGGAFANCGISIGDEVDIARLLRLGLGQAGGPAVSPVARGFTLG
jgi:hypothetical protein